MKKSKMLILLMIIGIVAIVDGDIDNSIIIEADNDEADQALEHCINTAKSFLNAHYLQEIKINTLKTRRTFEDNDVLSCDITDDMDFWQIKILKRENVVDLLGVGLLKDIECKNDEIKNYLGEKFLEIVKARSDSEEHFTHNITKISLKPYPVYYSIYLKAGILSLIVGIAFIPLIGRLTNMIWGKKWMSSDSKICNILKCFDPIQNLISLKPKSYFKETPLDFLNGHKFFFIIVNVPFHWNVFKNPLMNYQMEPSGFFGQLLSDYMNRVNNLSTMFMITGFLISYLTLSRNYPSGKPISYISCIFKRICRLVVPAFGVNYFIHILFYFTTNLSLLEKKSKLLVKCSDSFLFMSFFKPLCKFGYWYIKANVIFSITGFLLLGIYLKKSQNSFIGDNRKKFYWIGSMMCILVILCLTVIFNYEYKIDLKYIRRISYYSSFLIGLMGGALYFEYIFGNKNDKLKNSVGHTLFNLIKESKRLSTTLIACSFIVIMIIRIDNTYTMDSKTLPYNLASVILMCGAFVGTLDIYNKIYGHWILEFLNNFTLEFYLVHGCVLQYYSLSTNVSYQNTESTYFYIIGMIIVYSMIFAMILKLLFSMPLGALIGLASSSRKNQVAQQVNTQDSTSDQNGILADQNLLERSSKNMHEKQD